MVRAAPHGVALIFLNEKQETKVSRYFTAVCHRDWAALGGAALVVLLLRKAASLGGVAQLN
jgi:hypothetical protein